MINAELHVVAGKHAGQVIPLNRKKFLIGRDQDCQLRPNSELISRHHCLFSVDDTSVRLRDLGSTNGTHVNGQQILKEVVLEPGDLVVVGKLEFELKLNAAQQREANAVPELANLEEDEAFLTDDTVVGVEARTFPEPPPYEPAMPHPNPGFPGAAYPGYPYPPMPMYPVGYPLMPGFPLPGYPPLPPAAASGSVAEHEAYDPTLRQSFLDLHQKLRHSSIVKRQPAWIYRSMLEVGITLMSRDPFQQVVVLDARRMPGPEHSDRIRQFLRYVCALLETVFDYEECGQVFHTERITQILRDIEPSLFCFFHVERLSESDLDTLRGVGFSQSKHRILYCGDNSYFTGRVFSGDIALHDPPDPKAAQAPAADSRSAADAIIARYLERRPGTKSE
jgi:pSer/pThr/pTyr-binding forkhead associated (FHA) protein